MEFKGKVTDIHRLIFQNTKEINYLKEKRREESTFFHEKKIKRTQTEIRENYFAYANQHDRLVFEYENYVGEDGLYESLKNHDKYTIEYCLCFIEIRPYFYRSGYMYQRLMKKLNQVPLNEHQRERFLKVKERLAEYKLRKQNEVHQRHAKSPFKN